MKYLYLGGGGCIWMLLQIKYFAWITQIVNILPVFKLVDVVFLLFSWAFIILKWFSFQVIYFFCVLQYYFVFCWVCIRFPLRLFGFYFLMCVLQYYFVFGWVCIILKINSSFTDFYFHTMRVTLPLILGRYFFHQLYTPISVRILSNIFLLVHGPGFCSP